MILMIASTVLKQMANNQEPTGYVIIISRSYKSLQLWMTLLVAVECQRMSVSLVHISNIMHKATCASRRYLHT